MLLLNILVSKAHAQTHAELHVPNVGFLYSNLSSLFSDSGFLLQPLCILSQNSNLRVRPEIVLKLASM